MGLRRRIACAALVFAALGGSLSACGGTNPTEGLTVCLWRLTDETDNPT